ncbi:nuclear transport factor 2 [Humulus lupulus]|uniref:nuclear transport factor 2 n=1 Tax=Humulus lupulus TaxID=3486 RepID=UPI002B40467C|nr:nuclear transport factor 2 [Humulus lupulus]
MAMQEAAPVSAPSAQVVGNAFVEQYYHIVHHSPELVHRFYQDSSSLSRPDSDGIMKTVSSMQSINETILSLKYEDYTVEIKTADAQESHEKGVIVLVTGCLTGKDNVRKRFTQTFFLAPQDKGYYVLNDVFRYVEENEIPQVISIPVSGVDESAAEGALAAEPEPTHAPDSLVVEVERATPLEEVVNNVPEVCNPSDNENGSVTEEEVQQPSTNSNENQSFPGVDSIPEALEDAPKQSYASILKVTKANTKPTSVHVANRTVRTITTNTDQQSVGSTKPASTVEASAPSGNAAPEGDSLHEEAPEGHSIYVRNLPYDATVEQLEDEFKKFGPIKHEGVQVRSSKQGFCFGFVEFENLTSMQTALEASPITIGDRQAVIEEKRTTTRVSGSARGKYSSGRPGFRSDSFRGRGNFSGGRNYGRNEFRNQGEYSGRGRGSAGRNGDGYQRNQNGRGGRQGGGNRTAVATT